MVKASELIAALEAGMYEAEVVDRGDLHPFLSEVYIDANEHTRLCRLVGVYSYHEDCAEHGIEPGRSEVDVLGVTFGRQILCMEDGEIEIDGIIEYDQGLTEKDLLEVADQEIKFVDSYVFARGADGAIYGYDEIEDIPDGFEKVSEEEAFKELSKQRPGLAFRNPWGS